MLDFLSGRFGRRGAWLIVLGAVWVGIGVGIAIDPQQTHSWVLYERLPIVVQAGGWWACGFVSVAVGLRGQDASDWLGHVALYLMPAIRLVCFSFSWVLWVGSSLGAEAGLWSERIGWASAWYAAVVWFLISMMLRLIADWPNPRIMVPAPPTGGDQERA